MNIYFRIALRYLFGRKSTNTINIITGISILGLSIGTAAIITVLSTFNGLQGLLLSLFNYFNPDIKIELVEGKQFSYTEEMDSMLAHPEIRAFSKTYEEFTLFQYGDRQLVAKLKGVDSTYAFMTGIDSTIVEGKYLLKDRDLTYAVAGLGVSNELGLNVHDRFDGMAVYMPQSKRTVLGEPFRRRIIYPIGSFAIQQEYDHSYVLTDLELVQSLAQQPGNVTAIEIDIFNEKDLESLKGKLKQAFGDAFQVRDRYEQQSEFLKLMNIEKWIGFLILVLAAILVAFNLVGAMWMIVLDKGKDFSILQSMGMRRQNTQKIVFYLGILIGAVSLIIGVIVSLILYFLQTRYALVRVPDSFVMEAYPIELRLGDFVITGIFILLIAFLSSIPASRRILSVSKGLQFA